MRSSLITVAIVAFLWMATLPSGASAQSDAETALQKARAAFAHEQFAEARDLLKTASQTDGDNPDIFLLLGRASYQMGDLDQAIAAWRKTLMLAPAQAYARKMVETLEGKILDTDVRLSIIESLLNEHLTDLAQLEIFSFKRDALSPAQHVRLLSLEAATLIDLGQAGKTLKSLRELAVRDPEQAKTAPIRLLTGKAKLALEGGSINEGLAILAAVKAESADAQEGAATDLALVSFRISQGEDAIEELAAWVTANPQHPDLYSARKTMVHAVSVFLEVAAQQPFPENENALTELDAWMAKAMKLSHRQS